MGDDAPEPLDEPVDAEPLAALAVVAAGTGGVPDFFDSFSVAGTGAGAMAGGGDGVATAATGDPAVAAEPGSVNFNFDCADVGSDAHGDADVAGDVECIKNS